jgi:DNA processing protein
MALVSEYPLGMGRPRTSPRNRIISGLAAACWSGAGEASGALITTPSPPSKVATFAIPGPITAPTSRGCHKLIQNGAKLTLV